MQFEDRVGWWMHMTGHRESEQSIHMFLKSLSNDKDLYDVKVDRGGTVKYEGEEVGSCPGLSIRFL